MSKSLYEFIKLPESFVKFCDGKNYFKEANLIIKRHAYNKVFYNEELEFSKTFLGIYYYIYSMLFSKYYVQNDKFGIQGKVQFNLHYENWMKSRVAEDNFKQLAKNPVNFDKKLRSSNNVQ